MVNPIPNFLTFFKFLHIISPGISNLGIKGSNPFWSQGKNEPLTIPVERFLSMLRFDSIPLPMHRDQKRAHGLRSFWKGKLDELGLELSL